mgnify:CR=1 FL=1|tara:strand:- start:6625 stop:7311 length:687 start_codon:yes stop_codon:yes gene_type:complete
MKSFAHILFDLDGTLIDHFTAIHEGYHFAQETLGLPPASYEKVRATVGGSVPVTMRRLIGDDQPQEIFDKAMELFNQRFSEVMLEMVSILPGVEPLLKSLVARKIPVSVFTNKNGVHARAVLEHLGLAGYFNTIIGAGDTEFRKPEPEFTDHVLEVIGTAPAETLMIGDSPFDVEAGKVRDLWVAVVATGSHTADELRETEADWVFADMEILGRDLLGETSVACSQTS